MTAGRLTGKEQTRAGRRAEAVGRCPEGRASEMALNGEHLEKSTACSSSLHGGP